MQIAKKVLAVFLAALFVLPGLGVGLTASAEDDAKAVNLVTNGAADYITGAQTSNVWFGNYKQSSDGAGGFNVDPVKWRVLSNADGKLFLLSDQNLDACVYYERYFTATWETSTIRAWLNGTGEFSEENFKDSAFSSGEDAAVCVTDVSNPDSVFDDRTVPGGSDTADKVFLLSRDEAMNTAYGFTDSIEPTDTRVSINTAYTGSGGSNYGWTSAGGSADYWWLRSPGSADDRAAVIFETGQLNTGGYEVTNRAIAVRPAMNVDLGKVLFTSSAEGGKEGDGLTAVRDYTGSDWKLTLLDDSRSFAVTQTALSAISGFTTTMTYSGATVGESEYISAILTDENGVALYYGRLAQPTAANGTVEVAIPADLAHGTYTLKVFSEQYNGDKKTDLASAPVDVTLTVTGLFTGEGTEDAPYEIASDADWQTLAQYVADGGETAGKFFRQTADVTASVPVGSSTKPFEGTYDGSGKTLTAALDDASVMCLAPFSYILGATIENLRADGRVTGGQHCAGLVGGINGSGNLIRNCVVSAAITANSDYSAGVVGHGGSSETTIEGCVFTGSICGGTYAGAFWGRSESDSKVTIRNCLENAAEYTTANVNPVGMGFYSEQSITAVGYRTAQRGNPNRNWDGAGTQLYEIGRGENVTLTFGEATTFYDVSGLGVYDSGLMLCGSSAFAPANSTVALTASYTGEVPEGYDAEFSPSAGTLTDGKLTMPAQDVTISAKIVCNPKAIRLMTDGAALQSGFNTADAATVWYGSSAWRVVGYDGAGVASETGTATLLASRNMGIAYFDDGQNGYVNKYDGSTLKARVDDIAALFSATEQGTISKRTLVKGGYDGVNTDCIAGDADLADQLLWPLSTKEAYALNEILSQADPEHPGWSSSYWWLRSPGNGSNAAIVYGSGHVGEGGGYVSYCDYGVRPAFRINLQSVLFTSAAEGGKQGDGLTAVESYDGDDWKLTVLDESRSGFRARCTAIENGVYTITYSGAATGTNEKISAMVVDADGVVTYYGVLENAKAGENTLTLDVSGKLSDGDKLYVFNEQVNGDKKTDYASDLQDVTELFRYKTGDTILYGNYPQSEVPQTDALKAAAETSAWRSFGDYSGDDDGNPFYGYVGTQSIWQGDFFLYADFTLDGVNYRAVRFDEYRPRAPFMVRDAAHSMQDENGYAPNTVYYFKYEPIEWRVLDPDKGLVMCNTALDSRSFQNYVKRIDGLYYGDVAGTALASDWEHSDLRAWLNEDFLRTAFTAAQRANIAETTMNNDNYKTLTGSPSAEHPDGAATTDRVFLLSYADVIDPAYGFGADDRPLDDARQIAGSDYAKCRGLYVEDPGNPDDDGIHSYWYTRTASASNTVGTIFPTGQLSNLDLCASDQGVVPAMTLTEIRDDVEYDPIEPPVCRIGDTYYASIGEAIDDVTADDTVITILRDCEFDGLTEVAGHDIILESGETDVTVTLTGAMKFGKNNRSEIFTLRGNPAADTTLTIKPKLTDGTNDFRPIAVRRGNTLTVESGVVLEGSRFMTGNGGMVNVAKGATLNLNGGTIRDCSAIRGGAVYVDGGNCTIYEGRIENCTAEQGGAVYVSYNGKCFLYDGSIENCTAKHRTIAAAANSTVNAAGGAVYAVGLLQMENSTIKNCTAEYGKGGGIYLYPEQGTFWMQDSRISGCAATENADADLYYNDGRGGAVYVGKAKNTDAPDLCVVDSRITGNAAKEGGGVYLHEDGTMAAYKEAYISENTGGNVFVSDGAAIIAVMENSQYALTGNALIGVTTRTEPTIGAPVRFGKTKADCKEYFISDSGNADVIYDADGKALLLQCTKKEETPAATFNATGYDTGTLDGLTAGMTYAVNGGTPVTVEGTSVTFTDIALPFVITVVQPGDGVTAYDSDPQTIELTRPDAPTLEVTPIEKAGDKGVIPTTTAHQKSTDGSVWTDCDGAWTDLDGGTYYVRTKASGTVLASGATQFFFRYDPQTDVTVTAATQKEDTVITATFALGTMGEVEFTLTGKENQYSFTAPIEFGKAQISQKLATDDYALTVSFAGSDIFLSDTVQTSFTVACAHEWNEPTWDWTDVDNPTYTATCKLCADGTASGSVQSMKGGRVEATVNEDAYTPYTATVTLDGQPFTGTFNLVEKGTALGVYKEQMKQAAEDKRLPGDSDACNRLIDDAIDAIDTVTYDETKSLDENKQAVDDAANFAQLDADLAEHRAIHYAQFYADGVLTKRVPYTIDTESITEPAVPDKPGHTGAWPDYVLKAGGVRIDAVYEVIMQTVDFDPNGGAGEMESVTTAWGSKITLPECTFTAPNGKAFDKWDAGAPGDEVEVKSDLTVKAIWKEKPLTLTADVDPTQTGDCIAIRVPYTKRGAIAATLTASEDGVYYESSKPDVISVDENGHIRLEKLCLFCKTATITAYSASGEKVATCEVRVTHAWWQILIWLLLGSFWY